MGRLQGKFAIVTGSARGIGEAQARAIAGEGASVILIDVRPEGEKIATDIGSNAVFVQHDVSDEAGWAKVIALAEDRFGRIDILVNTAGIVAPSQPLAETSAENFLNVFKVNTLGVMLGMKAVVPAMTRAGGGAIINTVSAAAFAGMPETHPYAASKWAARGLTKSAATELAKSRIRVNAIFPGPVATHMLWDLGVEPDMVAQAITPVGFAAQPRDIADATVFLASDEARYIYGAELAVDGGQSI